MIQKTKITGGVMLSARPFSAPNRNAGCEIFARVTSANGQRRDVSVRVCGLDSAMALSDVAILMTAIRAITDEARQQMEVVQESGKAAFDFRQRLEQEALSRKKHVHRSRTWRGKRQ